MAPELEQKIDTLLQLSIDNQNEIKGQITELRELVHRGIQKDDLFLERLVEVESSTEQLSLRLNKIESVQLEIQALDRKGKWRIRAIVVTSILGWIVVIVQRYFG